MRFVGKETRSHVGPNTLGCRCRPVDSRWRRDRHQFFQRTRLAKQANDGGGAALEALAGAICAATGDAEEGIAALKGKRPPHFKGK